MRASNLVGPTKQSSTAGHDNMKPSLRQERGMKMRQAPDPSRSAVHDNRKMGRGLPSASNESHSVIGSHFDGNALKTGSQRMRQSRHGSSSREKGGTATANLIYRSASQRLEGQSMRSLHTSHSSPERLVNIVCPPSKGPKSRR